jgi:hypothetical protein
MTFINLFFSLALAHALVSYKSPDCSKLDAIVCNQAKIAEGKRVNEESGKELNAALTTCAPVKSVTYYIDKHVKTTELHGKLNGKCKMTIETHPDPSALQTCHFDDKAIALMLKDPKTYTADDHMVSRMMFNEQCNFKFLDPKVQVDNEKLQASLNGTQAKMKKDMIEEMQSDFKKLKANCQAGKKEACIEYEATKKEMTSDCNKPEFHEICKALEGI